MLGVPIFSIATTALSRNKFRTFLTVLGIAIGILMLVMIFALGNAAELVVLGELETYGADTIYTEIKPPGASEVTPVNTSFVEGLTITSLTQEDMEAMLTIPGVTDGYAGVMGYERVTSLYDDQAYTLYATTASYETVDPVEIDVGRFYTDSEDQSHQRVIVLGASAAEELFPGTDPLGQTVRVRDTPFKVIGVTKPQGIVFFQNMDDAVYMPLHTAQKLVLGIEHVLFFVVKIEDETKADEIKGQMVQLMSQRHETYTEEDQDFRVMTMEEGLEVLGTVTDALQILLLAMGLISLVVGGVGVMNVMVVSVTERTREIGLRKALGARPGVILRQFLMESVLLTTLGGLLGLGVGLGISFAVTQISGQFDAPLEFEIPLYAIVVALVAALLEGIFFGLYPAYRAARLHPIQALRKE